MSLTISCLPSDTTVLTSTGDHHTERQTGTSADHGLPLGGKARTPVYPASFSGSILHSPISFTNTPFIHVLSGKKKKRNFCGEFPQLLSLPSYNYPIFIHALLPVSAEWIPIRLLNAQEYLPPFLSCILFFLPTSARPSSINHSSFRLYFHLSALTNNSSWPNYLPLNKSSNETLPLPTVVPWLLSHLFRSTVNQRDTYNHFLPYLHPQPWGFCPPLPTSNTVLPASLVTSLFVKAQDALSPHFTWLLCSMWSRGVIPSWNSLWSLRDFPLPFGALLLTGLPSHLPP